MFASATQNVQAYYANYCKGATTLSIMTFSIATLIITIHKFDTQHNVIQHNNTQHNNRKK